MSWENKTFKSVSKQNKINERTGGPGEKKVTTT